MITDGVIAESDEVVSTTETTITVANGFANSYFVSDGSYLYTESSDFSSEPEPNGRRINMGAYGGTLEAATSADFNHDGDVDGSDLTLFVDEFFRDDCSAENSCNCDLDGDSDVDENDLSIFATQFGRVH